jgi:hypothetical protein
MGGVLAAIYNFRNWGQKVPHVNSHSDCACSNSSSSSSSEEEQRHQTKTGTWLEKHRPEIKHPPASKHHKGTQTDSRDHKRH